MEKGGQTLSEDAIDLLNEILDKSTDRKPSYIKDCDGNLVKMSFSSLGQYEVVFFIGRKRGNYYCTFDELCEEFPDDCEHLLQEFHKHNTGMLNLLNQLIKYVQW